MMGNWESALEAFVVCLLQRPDWQAILGKEIEEKRFVSQAVDLAAIEQIALQPEAMMAAFRQRRLPRISLTWPPQGWLPASVGADPETTEPQIDWLWIDQAAINAPFYEDVLNNFRSRPINRLVQMRTSLATLLNGAGRQEDISPTGLIYHMSRCGSTLVGRMLASQPDTIVLSEPSPLDAMINLAQRPDVDADAAIRMVRAIVAALGRWTAPSTRFLIKLDAWHTMSMPLLRAAFPAAPWVFLFREPLEVIVSHLKQPGRHTVQGLQEAERLLTVDDAQQSREIQIGKAISAIGGAALEHWPLGAGIAVNYTSLGNGGADRIMKHLGINGDGSAREKAAIVAKMDAKFPDRAFVSDSFDKVSIATDAAHEAARGQLAHNHRQLLRLAGLDC
jgi:hypothetical protein